MHLGKLGKACRVASANVGKCMAFTNNKIVG